MFLILMSSCQNVRKARLAEDLKNQKSSVQSKIYLSRHGSPLKLNIEIQFQGYPKCASYEFDVEVYKNKNSDPIYREKKSIKLKEYKCHPCLPAGPINNCGNTCEIITLRPLITYINFELAPYFKDKSQLKILLKNFKGLSKVTSKIPLPILETGSDLTASTEIHECENEIPEAELLLNFPESILNR